MQMWILRVDFFVFVCLGARSTYGTVPTWPHRDPRLTKKLLSAIFWFSTGAQNYAAKSTSLAGVTVTVKPKIHVGLTEVSNCRATTAAVTLECLLSTHPSRAKAFWSVTGGKTLEGLN